MASAVFHSILPGIVPFPVPPPLRELLARWLGFDDLERVYDRLRSMDGGGSIAERLVDWLSVSYAIPEVDLGRIPRSGPAILTLNHPFGILEGAVLAKVLARVRPDFRLLANGLLTALPELRGLLIPVDPISGSKAVAGNGTGLRRSLEHLEGGGMLVVFPAGEVSHFRWSDHVVSDPEWNPAVARLVGIAARRGCPTPVVPTFVEGANGPLFQLAGLVHPRLRTALLGRELLNKRGRRVEVRVGTPVAPEKLLAMPTAREQVDYLRWRTYLLGRRERYKPRTSVPLPSLAGGALQAIVDAQPAADLAAEIAGLPNDALLNRSGDLEVYITGADDIPNVLREIGRLREITFRAAGEGTGKPLDIDEFDREYLHLFVWNARRQEVVGAYRLAGTDSPHSGGLYTATLFQYGQEFLDRIGPALELGRSFVRQEYQRGFAPLLLLWKGIGAYVARHPRYRILFGPVSISDQYHAISREIMVEFLEKYAVLRDFSGLIRGKCAPRRGPGAAFPSSGFEVEDLSEVISDIEERPAGVPVLLRQYLRLGGKLLGFHVDAKFANTLDGLILVDLTRTEPKLLDRYLGKAEAAAILAFQKGNYGTH